MSIFAPGEAEAPFLEALREAIVGRKYRAAQSFNDNHSVATLLDWRLSPYLFERYLGYFAQCAVRIEHNATQASGSALIHRQPYSSPLDPDPPRNSLKLC